MLTHSPSVVVAASSRKLPTPPMAVWNGDQGRIQTPSSHVISLAARTSHWAARHRPTGDQISCQQATLSLPTRKHRYIKFLASWLACNGVSNNGDALVTSPRQHKCARASVYVSCILYYFVVPVSVFALVYWPEFLFSARSGSP